MLQSKTVSAMPGFGGRLKKVEKLVSQGWRVVGQSPGPHGLISVTLERGSAGAKEPARRTQPPPTRPNNPSSVATNCAHTHQTIHGAAGKTYTICLDCDQVISVKK